MISYKKMKHTQRAEIRYYQSYTDDFAWSRNQSFQLSEKFMWVHRDLFHHIISKCLYLIAVLFAFPYCRFGLHMTTKNRSVLRQQRNTGCFLYGNHTQPMGDAFIPGRVIAPKRIYIVVSPSNLGIPVLGSLLPMLGALPLPNRAAGVKKLEEAVRQRISEQSCVVIYPEAHVWPWYTEIRPFPASSFGFPVEYGVPSFCMTTTYQKRRYGKKPGITVYLDGPFYPDGSLPKKIQKEQLRDEIYDCMVRRSQNSTYQYVHYKEGRTV